MELVAFFLFYTQCCNMKFNISQMKKAFDSLCYGTDRRKVFDLFLDYSLGYFNLLDPEREKKQIACFDQIPYDKAKAPELFKEMFLGLGEASDPDGTGLVDALGFFYMQEVATNHMGQFFTPLEICDLMAALTMGATEKKPGETIADPACGSGTMLLAAAKHNRKAIFYGADLDYTCCKMTALNMLLNGLDGEVSHMNTLSLEFYGAFKIGKHSLLRLPAYQWVTDKMQSILFNNPLPPEVVKAAYQTRPAYLPGLF